MKDITASAAKLARNPLGIIALFIVLVYGFACLALGAGGAVLDYAQRWALIGFLVLFPFVVLWLFYTLVTKHHWKLYAPTDFKREASFLSILPTTQLHGQAQPIPPPKEIEAKATTAAKHFLETVSK